MKYVPFYDPRKSYEENFKYGPFGAFSIQKKEPQYEFLGQKVYLPFGIANGPLINGNFVKAALDNGFDLVEYKDVRSKKFTCKPFPNVIPVAAKSDISLRAAKKGLIQAKDFKNVVTIADSFGIPSMDPDFWQKDITAAVKYAKKGQVVIGGIQGTIQKSGGFDAYVQDFIIVARLLKETGVKIIELNLSCPNEGVTNLLCFDYKRSVIVAEKVKNEIGNIPLLIKIAYFFDNTALTKLVQGIGNIVQGISAINTIPSKVFKNKKHSLRAFPDKGRLWSGTSGHGIKWAGVEMVEKLKKLREKNNLHFSIVGIGGVMTTEDYREYKEVGADAVMSATGAIWNPFLAQEIKNAL